MPTPRMLAHGDAEQSDRKHLYRALVLPAVLFDLDGTLIDHEAAARSAVVRFAGGLRQQVRHSPEALVAEWLRLEAEHFDSYLAGAVTFEEQRRSRLTSFLDFLGDGLSPQRDLDLLFATYLEHYQAAWCAYDDVTPALDVLSKAGVAVGVLTNGQEAQQRAKLSAVGLLDWFRCVIASSTLPAAKPAPQAFSAACERLGRPPHDVVYVGDNLHTDALAATRAGLRGIWLNRLGELPEQPPPETVTDLHQLVALVLTNSR